MRYGFIGLGNLGGHLAASLIAGGFGVTVCDQDKARGERHIKAGGRFADTPKSLGTSCGAVITCLPSPQASERVLQELIAAGFAGTWIEMSTLGRDEIVRLGGLAAGHGIRTLECPVTGGVHLAARGEITL